MHHPEAFKEGIEDEIKERYYSILSLQDQLYATRDIVRSLEKQLKTLEDEFKFYKDICDIEFEKKEKEYKTQTVNVGFKGLIYGH